MSSDVEIIEKNPVKKGQPRVLTGFAGAGFVGNTALMYIIRQKEFELKAEIRSKYIPPSILLLEGVPTYPFRIYGDKNGEILLIVSEALVPPENTYPVGKAIMEWLQKNHAKDFVFIEAMPINTGQDGNILYGFSIPDRNLYSFGVKPLREGGVSGMNAVMLDTCIRKEIPATTLIAPTTMVSGIDYSAAASTIDVLSKMYKLGVDLSPLRKGIEMQKEMQARASGQQGQPQPGGKKKSFFDSFRKKD